MIAVIIFTSLWYHFRYFTMIIIIIIVSEMDFPPSTNI